MAEHNPESNSDGCGTATCAMKLEYIMIEFEPGDFRVRALFGPGGRMTRSPKAYGPNGELISRVVVNIHGLTSRMRITDLIELAADAVAGQANMAVHEALRTFDGGADARSRNLRCKDDHA